jgi:Protein of unknown function/Domain of unknown function (DUF1835)
VRTLHIAPGDSAGGSLRCALRDAGRDDDDVLSWLDDLSCGPIASGEPKERAEWWARFYDDQDIEATFSGFWDRVLKTDDRLVVWFSNRRASELACFLAWADRLGDRPYDYIDVTGRQCLYTRRDGSRGLSQPMLSVGEMNPEMLQSLFGLERPASTGFREESIRVWRHLRAENAPFRIITDAGLASAPIDVFDPWLLERTTSEWRSVNRITGEVMGYNADPYMQVGDVMLRMRIAALVDEGKLLADGDPWDTLSGRVRLPG